LGGLKWQVQTEPPDHSKALVLSALLSLKGSGFFRTLAICAQEVEARAVRMA
jgi:hypothetical protein